MLIKQNLGKPCKIERSSKTRAWCTVHSRGYDPSIFSGGVKECPDKCGCYACIEVRKFFNETHWTVPPTKYMKLAREMFSKIHKHWGGT